MSSPTKEKPPFDFDRTRHSSDDDGTVVGTNGNKVADTIFDSQALRDRLHVETERDHGLRFEHSKPSPSRTREESNRLNDEVALMKAERIVSRQNELLPERGSISLHRSRSRNPEPVIDEFDAATNPVHERTAVYKPPENPTTKVAKFFKYIHNSSFLVRYFTYIVPVFVLLLIPILIGAIVPVGQNANVGGVQLLWFGVWLEIVWLTLWAGRIAARMIPYPLGLVSSLFTNNSKKWRDMGKQLEVPATLFFWWLGIEISFLPTMKNHHVDGNTETRNWENTVNKIIIAFFVGACLNFAEKIIIQLIAISFHLRTYADRIELNKFQIGSLTKLYIFSKAKIAMEDVEFEEKSGPASGARTPAIYADRAQVVINKAFARVGDVAGTVAGDFTGKSVAKSGHPSQVVLALLNNTTGSQVLARRLYRTFVREGFESIFSGDLKPAFDNEEEADAAFTMFDKDLNGDISMEELESVCVEIGRERKSITASLKDLDSVVSKLDNVLIFFVAVVAILVLISLISTSAAGVLTSAGSAVLALSWLFSATAQEFLQSCIFVFVKHPFDVGDRVSIYGNTGSSLKGDDYFVKEISLLYTEFKKMEGQIVQAPNSYLNTLFILNMRRSGGLAEAVPISIRFGTTLEQIDALRTKLTEFVTAEKREYQGKILTELRDVVEAYSLTLNVIFFYKSNWQNELLRLQRRNKFICALMVAMQELGIEGPRRNQAGWRNDIPMYLQYPQGPPPIYGSDSVGTNPGSGSAAVSVTQTNGPADGQSTIVPGSLTHPSILRTRASPSRPRGESLSRMARHVDFSLGIQGTAAGDDLSDVYEDQNRASSRLREVIQEMNEQEEVRKQNERRESVSKAAKATGSASQEAQDHNQDHVMSGGLFRRGTSNSLRGRVDSVSSQQTHRNRFLSRLGHTGHSLEQGRDSLAEEGQAGPIDSRSGNVSTQAVRMESSGSIQPEPLRLNNTASNGSYELKKVESRRL